MKHREIPRRFWLAGALLLAFILLPLLSLLFSSRPAALAQTLVDAEVLRSLGVTFAGAGIATALGLLLGLPLAFVLARASFPGKGWVEALVDLPVIIPHTAAGVALLLVFGRQGVLGRWLTPLGLYFTDNLAGIVVAMRFVSLPLLVHPARAALAQLDREVEQSARGAVEQSRLAGETVAVVDRLLAGVAEAETGAARAAETAESARDRADEGARTVAQVAQVVAAVQDRAESLRSSMDAQSQASVPPAPAWMSMKQLLGSAGLLNMRRNSSCST